jgi:hypothetical protein
VSKQTPKLVVQQVMVVKVLVVRQGCPPRSTEGAVGSRYTLLSFRSMSYRILQKISADFLRSYHRFSCCCSSTNSSFCIPSCHSMRSSECAGRTPGGRRRLGCRRASLHSSNDPDDDAQHSMWSTSVSSSKSKALSSSSTSAVVCCCWCCWGYGTTLIHAADRSRLVAMSSRRRLGCPVVRLDRCWLSLSLLKPPSLLLLVLPLLSHRWNFRWWYRDESSTENEMGNTVGAVWNTNGAMHGIMLRPTAMNE